MGNRSFPGIKCGWAVLLTTHPLLVPRPTQSLGQTGPITKSLYPYFYFVIIVCHKNRSSLRVNSTVQYQVADSKVSLLQFSASWQSTDKASRLNYFCETDDRIGLKVIQNRFPPRSFVCNIHCYVPISRRIAADKTLLNKRKNKSDKDS